MSSDSLYIVMPAYNEEANIKEVISDWYPMLEGKSDDSRLIVADSGSTDSTHKILLDLQKGLPKLKVLNNTGTKHGPKLIALYNHVIKLTRESLWRKNSVQRNNF